MALIVARIYWLLRWAGFSLVLMVSTGQGSSLPCTNVNKVSDLFERTIDDKPALERMLEQSKEQAQSSIASQQTLKELNISASQAEKHATELNNIKASELESKGQEERAKAENNYYDSLELDYSSPLISQHIKDVDLIAHASEKLLARLVEGLKELDIDCHQAKGNVELEPEYHLDIQKEQGKDTEYNQHNCEELRNRYRCTDRLTLVCSKKGVRYKEWEGRVMYLGGSEFWHQYHGWTHTIRCYRGYWSVHMRQDSHLNLERRNVIANRLGVQLDQIDGGTAPWDGTGNLTSVDGEHHVFEKYSINYRFRDIYPVCEAWKEEWSEQCNLE